LTATPLFTANRLLANLDGFINSWKGKNLIEDSLYGVMRQAGGGNNIYVMPWNTQVLYVYYRPSMFRAAGIDVPKTYDEFLEACRRLTRNGVYGFGMRGSTGGQEPWGSFIYARGGNFNNLDSPQAIQGMRDYIALFNNGYAPPTAPTDGFQQIIAGFRSGMTAMTIHHTGSSGDMEAAFGDDVSAFPFPRGTGQWTSMGDTNNVIFESCKNKEAAFEWLAYLATGKGQETWCTATGNVPVSKEVQKLSQFQNNRFMKASIEGAPYAGILPILPSTTEFISVTWPNTVAGALTGRISAEEAMRTLQRSLHGN
jgi:multiple sugar transport system substrate-binding protein